MILQALTAYYEALLQKGAIAAPGWDGAFKVSFWLEVNDSGELIDIIDCRRSVQRGKGRHTARDVYHAGDTAARRNGASGRSLCH